MQPAVINIFEKAVKKAGKILLRDFGELENLQIQSKSVGDFVTNADIKVEKTLLETLKYYYPDYTYITEESGEIKGDENTIIIDPIDGTSNFMHGIPHFAISIALKKKGEVISGIICDPIKNETFYAEKGRGSYVNNRRIRVSSRKNLEEIIGLYGCPPMAKVKENKFFDQLQRASIDIHKLRNYGSAALDFAYVASGRADFAWYEHLKYWDYAAGKIILLEAGGTISDFAGKSFDKKNETYISNSLIHDQVHKILFKN